MLYIISVLLSLLIVGIVLFLNTPKFGKLPSGERLKRIEASPNYKNGKFVNLEHTPQLTSDKSFIQSLYEYLFKKAKSSKPTTKVPAEKTNLSNIPNNSMVWFGHSSYFIRLDDKNLLIDPVFNEASPLFFMVKPFDAEYNYSTNDIPNIDLLIITHDHWDHLDYKAIKKLKGRISKILCPLGVGSHLEYWGFSPEQITELDWDEETSLLDMKITCLPTRHFSGRGLLPTKTLWGSFMLQAQDKTVYVGGDSGYGKHFSRIGAQFPNIDFAILENGQYDEDWKHIHTQPYELPKVMKELGAKLYFTGHNSKFELAKHSWQEPLETIKKIQETEPEIHLLTPKIGRVEAF
ncbi:MAG: MBL fold metallo-hydrolase [Bergeyella cardium]